MKLDSCNPKVQKVVLASPLCKCVHVCRLTSYLTVFLFLFLLYCNIKGLSKLYERQHLSSACVSLAELTSIFMPATKCGMGTSHPSLY